MMSLNHLLPKFTGGYNLTKFAGIDQSPNVYGRHQTVPPKWKTLETLIQVMRIYSQNIMIEFRIKKCAMLIMRSGKRQITEGSKLPIQAKIKMIVEKEAYN